MAPGFRLKACPRCGGDMYDEVDVYGAYRACLQCGHYICRTVLPSQQYAAILPRQVIQERKSRPRLKYN